MILNPPLRDSLLCTHPPGFLQYTPYPLTAKALISLICLTEAQHVYLVAHSFKILWFDTSGGLAFNFQFYWGGGEGKLCPENNRLISMNHSIPPAQGWPKLWKVSLDRFHVFPSTHFLDRSHFSTWNIWLHHVPLATFRMIRAGNKGRESKLKKIVTFLEANMNLLNIKLLTRLGTLRGYWFRWQ